MAYLSDKNFGVASAMTKAVSVESYKLGDEAKTRWGHWKITNVEYADPVTQLIPVLVEKDITVNPGESLSAQMHFGRGEVYKGISGTTMVCVESEVFVLKAGDEVNIPRGALHFSWVEADEKAPAVFHEVQSGPHCCEKDIKRGADRQKLNLPHLLNPTDDPVMSVHDILLDERMRVAQNRFENEGAKHAYDRNDFMAKAVNMMKDYPQGFSDPEYRQALRSAFSEDISRHLALHERHTPKLEPKVEKEIRAKLVKC